MRLFRATVNDIPRMMECARLCCREHGEYRLGGPLNSEHYASEWQKLIENGAGAMFLVENPGHVVVAGIGGAKYPAMLTGRLRASQIFIYVRPEYRGQVSIRKLMTEFEVWAVENGCSDIIMPLLDSMPIKTKDFYEHTGYQQMEVAYRKPLIERIAT